MTKKISKLILVLGLLLVITSLGSCKKNNKVIRVCASELPHADILENCVADILEEKGYKLEVSVLDWTLQNDAVASKDYDANYFQHVPYLETYEGSTKLFASCKVHYEPLGIYQGKATADLTSGTSFAICNDPSNAARALELLNEKGVIAELPVANEAPTFSGSSWTSSNGVTVTLIAEDLLVASMKDYDFVCLPCNTALTGNVSQSKKVAEEDSATLVGGKANVLAARLDDYNNDEDYKAKIDALTEVLLSKAVSEYVLNKWSGAITCNEKSQIDLR